MSKQVITGGDVPSTHLPFSPAIRANGFVFVSGQASVDERGQVVNDTFAGEMRRAMENTRKILAGSGLTFADVVQVRGYITDANDFKEYNELYREYFPAPLPARTTIVCGLVAKLKFEIEVVAATRSA
jgi:2-iminobutanoate/2-iminopropanoate deaminase